MSSSPQLQNAYLGSLVADALAMPGHWYYDRAALRRDYGLLDRYREPKNPHPDSILWRSSYHPANARGDILGSQAQFWGRRGVHYHQFLKAGENTLNFKLAKSLHDFVRSRRGYDAEGWLREYTALMLEPGWHGDTYVEEYHREFFTRFAAGKPLLECGVRDYHIGGLAQVPALVAALEVSGVSIRDTVRVHVSTTHRDPAVLRAADCLVRLLLHTRYHADLREAIEEEAGEWFSARKATRWLGRPDNEVIGQVLSPACYIDQAFPAALYLTWKYHDDFAGGITANAMAGGDSCHRGTVVGSLLAAANGIGQRWLEGLAAAVPTRSVHQPSPRPVGA